MRRLICNVLVVLGKQDLDAVGKGLNDRRWFVVRNTAMIIGAIKDPFGVKYLAEAVRHSEARVRREVIKSLVMINSQETKLPLMTALNDADPSVKIAALRALRRLGAGDAFGQIKSIILTEDFKRRPFDEKKEFLEALADIGQAEAFPVLARFFLQKSLFMKAEAKELREAAAHGLALVRTEEAVALLQKESDAGKVHAMKAGPGQKK
jgi:HEAT repeat protein